MGVLVSEERLEGVYHFFKNLADEQYEKNHHRYGIVSFSYDDMVKSRETFTTKQNYVSQVMVTLTERGLATRIKRGSASAASVWDVSPFLGYGKMKYERPQAEIEIVRKDVPQDTPKPVENNQREGNEEVLSELNQSIEDMNSHLRDLPIQMGTYLSDISAQLKLLDGHVVEELQKENNQLKGTVQELEAKLEEMNQSDYNKGEVERQCDLLVKKVDDIFGAPWKIGKHRQSYKDSITMRLDKIKKELGLIE